MSLSKAGSNKQQFVILLFIVFCGIYL